MQLDGSKDLLLKICWRSGSYLTSHLKVIRVEVVSSDYHLRACLLLLSCDHGIILSVCDQGHLVMFHPFQGITGIIRTGKTHVPALHIQARHDDGDNGIEGGKGRTFGGIDITECRRAGTSHNGLIQPIHHLKGGRVHLRPGQPLHRVALPAHDHTVILR